MNSPASTEKAPSISSDRGMKRKGNEDHDNERKSKKRVRDFNTDLEDEILGKKKLTLPLTKSGRGVEMLLK